MKFSVFFLFLNQHKMLLSRNWTKTKVGKCWISPKRNRSTVFVFSRQKRYFQM